MSGEHLQKTKKAMGQGTTIHISAEMRYVIKVHLQFFRLAPKCNIMLYLGKKKMLFTEKFYVFVSAKLQSTSISEDTFCPLLSHQMFPDNAHPWLTITTHPDGSLFRGHILK